MERKLAHKQHEIQNTRT